MLFFFVIIFQLIWCSSHSESPSGTSKGAADLTDVYAFRSYEAGREDTVTFIMNSSPMQAPVSGPNYGGFSQSHWYQFAISESGCTEDHVFNFYFGANLGGTNGTYMEVEPNYCTHTSSLVPLPGNTGFEIPIKDASGATVGSTPIPLKTAGPYSNSGADGFGGASNYNSYFHVAYSTAVDTQNPTDLVRDLPMPFPNAGPKTIPDYEQYLADNGNFVHSLPLGSFCPGQSGRVFAGKRKDSFSVNLGAIFDLVNMNPIPGFGNSMVNDERNNDLSNSNVETIALEVPISCFGASTIGVVGYTRELYHTAGDVHNVGLQTSRLGHPLVNEVVIGVPDKPRFNVQHPTQDGDFARYVTHPSLPALIDALFLNFVQTNIDSSITNLAPTNIPRNDLVAIFLNGLPNLNAMSGTCELLRLNMDVPAVARAAQNHMGVFALDVAGFPNGRRPGDDVVDIALQAVMGRVCSACAVFGAADALNFDVCGQVCNEGNQTVGGVNFLDGAPQMATQFMDVFPYLSLPLPGNNNDNIVVNSFGSSSSASEMVSLF